MKYGKESGKKGQNNSIVDFDQQVKEAELKLYDGMTEDELVEDAVKKFNYCVEFERENRLKALDDLKFSLPGEGNQWDAKAKQERETDGRPCLEINRIDPYIRKISGDFRQNKISIKVVPKSSDAQEDIADALGTVIKEIEQNSFAPIVYAKALDQMTRRGFSVIKISSKYVDDATFDQDLLIENIKNPFSVYFDPDSVDPHKRDANFVFVETFINKDLAEKLYPGKAFGMALQGDGQRADWLDGDKVRIVEFWKRCPVKKTIYAVQGQDGSIRITDELMGGEEESVIREREVISYEVKCYKLSAQEFLDKPYTWPGKYIPYIKVPGNEEDVEGKPVEYGLVRGAKDPQRQYNYWRSAATELVGMGAKTPVFVTPEMIENHESEWANVNRRPKPYIPFNRSPGTNDAPIFHPGSPLPQGEIAQATSAIDDIRATTGVRDELDPSIQQQDTSNFVYQDNIHSTIRCIGEHLVDLIPKVYDTERLIRALGDDEEEKQITVNQTIIDPATGQPYKLNDLSIGRYKVEVTVAAATATRRQEAVKTLQELINHVPLAGQVSADIIAKNMDFPGAQELAKRMRKMMILQGVIEPNEQEKAAGLGKQEQPPDPKAVADQMNAQNDQLKLQLEAAKEARIGLAEKARIKLEYIDKGFEPPQELQ